MVVLKVRVESPSRKLPMKALRSATSLSTWNCWLSEETRRTIVRLNEPGVDVWKGC